MGNNNESHKLYWKHSPEYTHTVSRWGRNLAPEHVAVILYQHGFRVADLLDDMGVAELPDVLDAAALYAWLGY